MKRLFVVLVAACGIARGLGAQASYKRELPDSLLRHARIAEREAATIAAKRVPAAKIVAVELEREKGRLIYSYDMKIEGRPGTEEVNIDAATGKVIGVEHESAAQERKEAAAENPRDRTKKP